MKSHPANALITETSPYLQQHAHNPVRWYPWGEEALSIAREKDMPILVSIGYSACHWCHVMERESFEDDHVASFMNEHFVNIKIDREERPDLDHFYMDAVQAISGSGGWPLNVFLTPETKPFYGGTYYPPTKAFNRSSWMEVLQSISDVFKNKRDEVEKQAETLVNHLREANGFAASKRIFEAETESFYSTETCRSIAGTILSAADKKEGGFGKAPKFLQTPLLIYLLQYAHLSGDEASLTHAVFTLKKMLNGGIYDQIGGGISRYSTDNEWLVPHFEKMLYDNALFVIALSEAYQLTGHPQIGNGIRQTLDFVQKELKDKAGGYYTAIDADSEGVEGKFYVWDKQEIESLLGAQSELFCDYFNVTTVGNWEEGNILNITADEETMALKYGLPVDVFKATVNSCKEKLLSARNKRVPPSLDDKILLNCNSLLLSAFCKAYPALGDETYKKAAEELFTFIELNLVDKSGPGSFYHSFKNGQGRYPAFLDDYAYLIEGLILLQEITSNQEYLTKATLLTQYVVKHFTGEGSHFFYYSNSTQMDLIVRKVEVYDGATPSANAVMAKNLLYLGIVFDNLSWRDQASNMLYSLKDAFLKYPTSFGVWSGVYLLQSYGINEITITGDNIQPVLDELLGKYIPNKILQSTRSPGFEERPMLKNKLNFTETKIYLCRDYVCQSPCSTVDELIDSIKNLSIK